MTSSFSRLFYATMVVGGGVAAATFSFIALENGRRDQWARTRGVLRNADLVRAKRDIVDFYRSHNIDPAKPHREVVEQLKERLKGAQVSTEIDCSRARLLRAYEELSYVVEHRNVRAADVYLGDVPSTAQVRTFVQLVKPLELYNLSSLSPSADHFQDRAKGLHEPDVFVWLEAVYLPTRLKFKPKREAARAKLLTLAYGAKLAESEDEKTV